MWHHLSDPCHAAEAARFDSSTRPLAPVLAAVAECDYANFVFGHWSHSLFVIGTAPSYAVSASSLHKDILLIECDEGEFTLGFGETPSAEWGIRFSNGETIRTGRWITCDAETALATIGNVVRRFLDDREPGWDTAGTQS